MTTPVDWHCRHTDEPLCPYCGNQESDFYEVDSDSGEHQCSTCGRPFFYERQVSVSYNTSPVMGPHRQTEWDQQCELEAEEDRKVRP